MVLLNQLTGSIKPGTNPDLSSLGHSSKALDVSTMLHRNASLRGFARCLGKPWITYQQPCFSVLSFFVPSLSSSSSIFSSPKPSHPEAATTIVSAEMTSSMIHRHTISFPILVVFSHDAYMCMMRTCVSR